MRKLLLSLFAMSCLGASGQDLSLALDSPAAGSTIGPGIPTAFSVTITNVGSVDVTTSDTIWVRPMIHIGNDTLGLVDRQDTTQIIEFPIIGASLSANGGSTSQKINFAGFEIDGVPSQFDFCGRVFAKGPNWGSGGETDISNNTDCNTINYDAGGTTAIAEYSTYVKRTSLQKVIDNSFFANGSYNLDVKNLNNGLATVQVFNITGQEIRSLTREVKSGKLGGAFELGNVGQGVYIVSIAVEGKTVSAKKIMVQ